jgi:(p)ppGpp synthase/HD superfamily hydrolase
MATQLTTRFDDALAYATHLHRQDVRKGADVPYVAHLLSVCALVLEDGGTEDEAVAALLHDALEDHPTTTDRREIASRYGERVLELVEGCTDTPADYLGGQKPPWRARKEAYVEHVRGADPGAVRVSLADKLHNARAILSDYRRIGDEVWSRFRVGRSVPAEIREEVLWYYRAMESAFREAGATGYLIEELERTLREIDRLVREANP